MSQQAGNLDQVRWIGLWGTLGAEGSGLSVFARLTAAYAEPARFYHTAAHIHDCLAQFDSSRHLALRPDEVEAALWFHDAVYRPGGSDNEDRSAELARAALVERGVSSGAGRRVAGLIRATQHSATPRDPDTALLCDIDLSILGRQPEVFDEFERRIRSEYARVPEAVYRSSRSEVLRRFLQRDSVYRTEYFRDRYEVSARANLERMGEKLGG